ncbi:hypothetical protein [Phaeodactylibacter sp.]|nr:hypothetical protein [Phaeodactylibacter sp.]MCI4651019.1 hypothetical protein [Phaeodactylibacter sp.]MCI5089368.1 hypothetical protein [Phaeodactylibacter sp.]
MASLIALPTSFLIAIDRRTANMATAGFLGGQYRFVHLSGLRFSGA